jgi:succinate dehydrogenase / fumarate reductase, cytochrome b subunit
MKLRKLSPHLTIYKAQLTSALSVIHRMTGSFVGLLVLVYILFNKILDYHITDYFVYYVLYNVYFWLLLGILVSLALSLSYHTANGLRHFVWDYLLLGFQKDTIKSSGVIVMIITAFIFFILLVGIFNLI